MPSRATAPISTHRRRTAARRAPQPRPGRGDRLPQRHGYLRRERDPSDERARLLRLTERGHELEGDIAAASARLHLQWYETLGGELFNALWTALQRLSGLDGPPPDLADLRRRARR